MAALDVLRAAAPRLAAELPRLLQDLPERAAMEHYGGVDACAALFGFDPQYVTEPGLWHRERPRVTPEALAPWRGRLGLYTGRNDAELTLVLDAFGLGDLFPPRARISASGPWRKPDPGGLLELLRRLDGGRPLYVGDSIDDAETARRARTEGAPIRFAAVVGEDEEAGRLQGERGADLLVRDVPALLRWLSGGLGTGPPPSR